jgi:hypothetical protein
LLSTKYCVMQPYKVVGLQDAGEALAGGGKVGAAVVAKESAGA